MSCDIFRLEIWSSCFLVIMFDWSVLIFPPFRRGCTLHLLSVVTMWGWVWADHIISCVTHVMTLNIHLLRPQPSIRLSPGLLVSHVSVPSFPLSAVAPAASLSQSAPTLIWGGLAQSRPCSVHCVHTVHLYTCGEMSECADTPSQLWGCHIFSQTTLHNTRHM